MTATLKGSIKPMLQALTQPAKKIKLGPLQIVSHTLLHNQSHLLELSDSTHTIHATMSNSVMQRFLTTNSCWSAAPDTLGSILQLDCYTVGIDISMTEFYIEIEKAHYLSGAQMLILGQPRPYTSSNELKDYIQLYRNHTVHADLQGKQGLNALLQCGQSGHDVQTKWTQPHTDWDKQCYISDIELAMLAQQWKQADKHIETMTQMQQYSPLTAQSQFTQSLPDSYVPITHSVVPIKQPTADTTSTDNLSTQALAIAVDTTSSNELSDGSRSPSPLTPMINTLVHAAPLELLPVDLTALQDDASHTADTDDSTSLLKRDRSNMHCETRSAHLFQSQISLASESNLYDTELQSSASNHTARTNSTAVLTPMDTNVQQPLRKRAKLEPTRSTPVDSTQSTPAAATQLAQPDKLHHVQSILPETQLQLLNHELTQLSNKSKQMLKQLHAATSHMTLSQTDEFEVEQQSLKQQRIRQQYNKAEYRIREIHRLLDAHNDAVQQQQQQASTADTDMVAHDEAARRILCDDQGNKRPVKEIALAYMEDLCKRLCDGAVT